MKSNVVIIGGGFGGLRAAKALAGDDVDIVLLDRTNHHLFQPLLSFEHAEIATDPDQRKAFLTFIVIGGGPTGVEMAGAIAEIAHKTMLGDFREINPAARRRIRR